MSRLYCILDYETRSKADLKRCGAYEYSRHPSTELLCAAWRIGTKADLRKQKVTVWTPFAKRVVPLPLQQAFADPEIIFVAQNAFFEQVITYHVLPKYPGALRRDKGVSIERWLCTATQLASHAMPRNLENGAKALGLPIEKDMEGHRLMLKMSKPRKPTKHNKDEWHFTRADLNRLMQYCATDVEAETEVFLSLPELNEREKKIWYLDQRINWRGFGVDRDLAAQTLRMAILETSNLNEEARRISGGELQSANQREVMLKLVKRMGADLPDLRAKTIADALSEGLVTDHTAKRLLEIRQSVSKTSTAKYPAFLARSASDGRLRDMLTYHAASTGRWGGAGVQPQNFPRGNIKNTTQAAEILKDGDLEMVRLIYGDPMSAFSSCLRSVIVPSEGNELFCADYAAIEARVLFWVANHQDGIQAFLDDRDLYRELAAIIFGVKVEEVTKDQRFVGKQATLGCGYNMGWKKFIQTCKNLGQDVDEEIAQAAVKAYRSVNSPVVQLWGKIERAAIAAVQNPKKKFTINRTSWFMQNNFLYCELPSGRRLAYHRPKIQYVRTPWDEKRPCLYHWQVHPLNKKKWIFAGTYGGKLVENVVQAISRDFMAEAMLRVEAAGYQVVLTVHDELVAERAKGEKEAEDFCNLMAGLPAWGKGCPIKVEGWKGERYRK